jgi:hypothetical protein
MKPMLICFIYAVVVIVFMMLTPKAIEVYQRTQEAHRVEAAQMAQKHQQDKDDEAALELGAYLSKRDKAKVEIDTRGAK